MRKAGPKEIIWILIIFLSFPLPLMNQDRGLATDASMLYIKGEKLVPCLIEKPSDFNPSKTYSLVVGLHGNGGNGATFAKLWDGWINPQFIFVVPEGLYGYPKSFDKKSRYTWFLPTRHKELWHQADPLTEKFIIRVVQEISKRFKINRIILLGFSQGAALAYMVGIRNPHLVNGIACLGGRFPHETISPDELKKSLELKIFAAVGKSDQYISVEDFKNQLDFLKEKGFKVTSFIFKGTHQITRELLLKVQKWLARI